MPTAPAAAAPSELPWEAPASPQDMLKLEAQASACLDDAACDDAELARRLRSAAARGADVCSYWLEGLGVARDESLARACLERHVATESPPDGSSCSNARLQLALLIGLGRGGRAEPEAARRLLDGCFADMSQGSVLAAIEAGETPRGGAELCELGGLTTFSFGACSGPERLRAQA
ncbi:MAG TPA: hypothetical protein VFS00_29370, partial [Polyangiaceae bacterium]|nr:hypothetical protein [Polyangiaceae bacterium]